MSLESEIENQLFAVRRVVLASGWRQGLTSLFKLVPLVNPAAAGPLIDAYTTVKM